MRPQLQEDIGESVMNETPDLGTPREDCIEPIMPRLMPYQMLPYSLRKEIGTSSETRREELYQDTAFTFQQQDTFGYFPKRELD